MSNDKKLNGAIIGFGFISSKGHMPAYLERAKKYKDVDIIAICDICPERKSEVPEGIRFYSDYRELLAAELPNLDFVDVSTHAADHYKIARAALENGLHVLCEKPLTTTLEEAQNLISFAKTKNRVLFPCHNYKHAPVVRAIREVMESGKIGKVKSITLNTFRNTHAVGVKEWNPDWRRFKEFSGGGIAMDHGSHSLYLTFEWLGGYPKAVTASSFNFAYPKYDTEDNFSAVYEFESGVAHVHLTWTAGIRKVIYTLQGEKGAITVDDDQMQIALMSEKNQEGISHKADWIVQNYTITSDWMDSSHVSWFNSMFDKFKLAIETDDFVNQEIMDAYHCIAAITKSYESIQNNSIKLSLEKSFPYF
ncbi:MAG: Gfo/Idh/MocA family protein [Bacteriovorax sp.]